MVTAEDVQKFAKSSIYRHGDNLCFQVPIAPNLELPGRHNPAHYCLNFKTPGRAAVVCPGNGGLIAQLFLNGASEVVAIEPRARFHEPLRAVLKLFLDANPGKKVEVFTDFPRATEHVAKLGQFDSIIWSEGVDEISDPKVIQLMVATLKSSGCMKIEVPHGTSTHTDGKINNWRPTPEVWKSFASEVCTVEGPSGGRLGTTKTYMLTNPKAVKPAPKAEPKPEPKVEAPKKIEEPKPAPKEEPVAKEAPAFPRPEAPKPALKPDATHPIASPGNDDLMRVAPKPSIKRKQ